MTPCPQHLNYKTLIDPRYDLVAGGLVVGQQLFDDQNGLTTIWADRYTNDLSETNLIRQVRKNGQIKPFSRGTLGWTLECELDDTKISREAAFVEILDREIKS